MKIPDVLAPYASLIKWGLIALLSAGLFVSGCNHGENRGEKELTRVENNLALCQQANASWAAAAEERNAVVDSNIKASEKIQKEASKGADRIEDVRKSTDKAVAGNQSKLEAALRDPKCNELLEMNVCTTVPLP